MQKMSLSDLVLRHDSGVRLWTAPVSPEWFSRWFQVATLTASWSKDPNTKVGAVVFTKDNAPIAFGYNGLPRGVEDTELRLQDREIKRKMVVHAEANAILNAARTGAALDGAFIMVTHPCCSVCAGLIIQAGIKLVIYPDLPGCERFNHDISEQMFKEAGVALHKI